MDNAGIFTLGSLQITTPRALALLTPITGLDGMNAVTLECNFQGAAGGSTCSAIVATTFDGSLWRHIARFDFTTSPLVKVANLSGLLSKAVASYADLAAEGVNDGMLGNALALYVVSTGNYTNGVLTCRASVR